MFDRMDKSMDTYVLILRNLFGAGSHSAIKLPGEGSEERDGVYPYESVIISALTGFT